MEGLGLMNCDLIIREVLQISNSSESCRYKLRSLFHQFLNPKDLD